MNGVLSVKTGWQLIPSPPPVSLKELEADGPSIWCGYLTPFDPFTYRKPQSYVRYYIPQARTSQHFIDQWVTPGWKDELGSPNGPVWTNETVHFIIDNSLPLLNDLVDAPRFAIYNKLFQAGFQQKQARVEGKDDRLWGEGLADSEISFPWILSTISSSTEVKRLLPVEGCKWLFMRNTIKDIIDNRMDLEIVLLNETLELIATSHHICHIIHVDKKRPKGVNL